MPADIPGRSVETPTDDFDEDLDAPLKPPLPRTTVLGALQPALRDLYFGSVRLLPANIIWGVVLVALAWIAFSGGLWIAVLLAPLLGLPTIGIYRLAVSTSRGDEPRFADAFVAMRERLVPALLVAALNIWAAVLLAINIGLGLGMGSLPGFVFAIISGWGLVAIAAFTAVVWPLLADPARRDAPLRATLRLAAYLVLAVPIRVISLAIVAVVLFVASTWLLVLVVAVTAAYVALLCCRVVLPEADRVMAGPATRSKASPR